MLESMRKNMKWLMWITVSVITVTFLFFGIYPADIGGGAVAKVGDDVITKDDFYRVYRNTYEMYRAIMKDQFNESMAKELKVQTVRDMISERLLQKEAERIGLTVSDAELQAVIMKEPSFLRDGKFDRTRYERALDSINMRPAIFEANQRGVLLRQKLIQLVKDSVAVTDPELAAAYLKSHSQAKPEDFVKNKDAFRGSLLASKQREALTGYLKELSNKTLVTVNEKLLGS
ncbi:MAG: SurA N-terminal domain-containing protein [Nitrospirota bacterium]